MLCHELFFSTISFYYLPALNSLQGGENWLVLDILGYRAFNGTSLPMTWNVKLLFLILDWELATAFRESCFSLSPTLCSSVLNKGLTLPLSCYIINIYTGLREWEKGEVKNIRQQGRTESQRECGPKRAQASMWMKHWDDKEASFKDKPEIVLGQREIREQARAPDERQPESYATLSTHEWATEMERQEKSKDRESPTPPAPHQAVLCLACLLFFLLPPDPGYIWLIFCGSTQRPFQGLHTQPRRVDHCPSGLIWTPRKVLTVSTNGCASSPMTFLIIQMPISQEYFLSIFNHQ